MFISEFMDRKKFYKKKKKVYNNKMFAVVSSGFRITGGFSVLL